MSLKTIIQPPFICDMESDRDSSMPDNSIFYCKDTRKTYELVSGAFVLMSTTPQISLAYSGTTTSGTWVAYLTDNGLSTGNALFSVIKYIHIDFVLNNPNLGKSYAISSDRKTLTVSAILQTFTGVTVLGINVLGSVAISATANGTALTALVEGTPE